MKAILVAAAALIVTAAGVRAAEEYPTPVARPIMSSVPVLDVSGGGPWSTKTVVTGNGGYIASGAADHMPVALAPAPAATSTLVQHVTPAAPRG